MPHSLLCFRIAPLDCHACVSALSCPLCLIDGNCVLPFHPLSSQAYEGPPFLWEEINYVFDLLLRDLQNHAL